MPSQKQIQNRLDVKKKDLKNVTQYMSTADKDNKKILLRKLLQEKGLWKEVSGSWKDS